jgi:transcriptional regulator with XRE-family HTH domain
MNRLRITRLRQGLSQVRLFRMTGVWPSRISYFEHGLFEPSAKERKRISTALSVAEDWLFPATQKGKDGNKNGNSPPRPEQ